MFWSCVVDSDVGLFHLTNQRKRSRQLMPLYTRKCVCVLSHIVCSVQALQAGKSKSRIVVLNFEDCSFLSSLNSIMSLHYKIFSSMICLLLMTTMFPVVQLRRGGGFGRGGGGRGGAWGGGSAGRVGWGAGGGHPHHAPPPHTGGSSGHSTGKVVGAAAAGALGGMLVGHGLSSMAQPGYGHGHGHGYGGYGHGGYGHGYGYGHSRHGAHGNGHSEDHAESHNETDVDYYMGAASAGPVYNCVMVFGAVMSLLLGHFLP
ncbi:prion protein a [Triplophysa rosa]|uniref:Prion protein a n=1 Tax=Triplophysa rosa TaxID=992332 RepID=A0A9W7TK73_TRIRA|nr:prion protein a [Triplophysa rosa]KAI7797903.1 prion protein a precursor [Triplophysa rosa]